MRTARLLLAALTLMGASDDAGWRGRLPVTPAPGGGVQRLELPARAILAMQRVDGGDVRVLDARGRAQPLARLPAPVAPPRTVALEPLPILGATDALKLTGVTLKVDDGQAHVVRVDGQPAGDSAGQELLGVLFDTRRETVPAHALTLDLDAPANQPITVALESSDDLASWTPEGSKILYRTSGIGQLSLPLQDENLRGKMLRATWTAQTRLLSPVTVKRATLVLSALPNAARIPVRATLPPLRDPRTVQFILPLAVAPAAIRVEPAGAGAATSIEVSGRDNREQPWTPVGDGLATARSGGGAQVIEIGRGYREWQVQAGANDGGFDAPPQLELRFTPVAIAFLAAGPGPYTLAVGRADAGPTFVPLERLFEAAGMSGGSMSTATVAAAPPPMLSLLPVERGASSNAWLLWSLLLLGVGVLTVMAWTLLRGELAAVDTGL